MATHADDYWGGITQNDDDDCHSLGPPDDEQEMVPIQVYNSVAAGESVERVRRVLDLYARGSEERRREAAEAEGFLPARRGKKFTSETPLQAACRLKRGDLVGFLLVEAGAAVEGLTHFRDGAPPLAVCCAYGEVERVRELLGAGHNPDDKVPCRRVVSYSYSYEPCKAVHICVRPPLDNETLTKRHLGFLRALVKEGGADVDAIDSDGNTALSTAVRAVCGGGRGYDNYWRHHSSSNALRLDALRLLIKLGARTSGVFNSAGMSPLMLAIKTGHEEAVQVLLSDGNAPADERSPMCGGNALHFLLLCTRSSSRSQSLSTARLLIDSGADVNATDKHGRTPLQLALESGDISLVVLLLEKGASVDVAPGAATTPLIDACSLSCAPAQKTALITEVLRLASPEHVRAVRQFDRHSALDVFIAKERAGYYYYDTNGRYRRQLPQQQTGQWEPWQKDAVVMLAAAGVPASVSFIDAVRAITEGDEIEVRATPIAGGEGGIGGGG